MGDQDFALAMSFYAPDHPDSVPAFDVAASPWVTPARIESEGFAVVCRDASCARRAMQLAINRDARQQDIEVVRRFFGSATAPERFTLVLVPPRP